MDGGPHSRQLNETHSSENLLLEKENKMIPFSWDVNPHILSLSIWNELYIVLISFQLEYWVLQKLLFD